MDNRFGLFYFRFPPVRKSDWSFLPTVPPDERSAKRPQLQLKKMHIFSNLLRVWEDCSCNLDWFVDFQSLSNTSTSSSVHERGVAIAGKNSSLNNPKRDGNDEYRNQLLSDLGCTDLENNAHTHFYKEVLCNTFESEVLSSYFIAESSSLQPNLHSEPVSLIRD